MAPTADGELLRISEALRDQILRAGGDVVHFGASRIFDVQVAEFLAVAGAAAIVGLEDDVSRLGEILRPRVETEGVLGFRSAVNPQDGGGLRACASVAGFVENSSDFKPVLAAEVN